MFVVVVVVLLLLLLFCHCFVCLFVCLLFFFADEKNQNNKIDERRDIGDYFWGAGYSHRTDFRPFYDKISANPEHKEDFRHHFSHRMGNVNWVCLTLQSIYTSDDISVLHVHITPSDCRLTYIILAFVIGFMLLWDSLK